MAWAGRFGVPAEVFRTAITSVTAASVELLVVRWLGRARRIEQRTATTASRSRTLAEPAVPSAFDSWTCDPEGLQRETLRLVQCPACAGEKKVGCPECGGRVEVLCPSCGGAGRVAGARGRLVNCRKCRGAGQARCPCRDGLVTCLTCAGKGRCQHWLEIVEEPVCREATTGDVRLREGRSSAVALVADEFQPTALPPPIAELLAEARFEQRWSADERIDRLVVERYPGLVWTLCYRLAGRESSLRVLGWSGAVDDRADTAALVRWRRLRAAAGASGLLLGLGLLAGHALRGPFYAASLQTLALAVMPALLAFAAARLFAVSSAGLGRRVAGYRIGEFALALLAAFMVLLSRQPALGHAEAMLRAGQRDAAAVEFQALLASPETRAQAGLHLDRMLLDDLRASPADLWRALAEKRFHTERGARGARAAAEQATAVAVETPALAGDFGAARSALGDLEPSLPPALHAQLAGFVDTSEAARLWEVIAESEGPLAGRLGACDEIQRLIDQGPVSEAEIARACAAVRKEEEARRERERREAERRERLARLAAEREERVREAARRAWARAPLLCNDGTLSPTCVCGQSSRRGCCSWHGGVNGCSREYPVN